MSSITVKNNSNTNVRVQLLAGETVSAEAIIPQNGKDSLQCDSMMYRVVVKKEGSDQQIAQKDQVSGNSTLIIASRNGSYTLEQQREPAR